MHRQRVVQPHGGADLGRECGVGEVGRLRVVAGKVDRILLVRVERVAVVPQPRHQRDPAEQEFGLGVGAGFADGAPRKVLRGEDEVGRDRRPVAGEGLGAVAQDVEVVRRVAAAGRQQHAVARAGQPVPGLQGAAVAGLLVVEGAVAQGRGQRSVDERQALAIDDLRRVVRVAVHPPGEVVETAPGERVVQRHPQAVLRVDRIRVQGVVAQVPSAIRARSENHSVSTRVS